MSMEIHKTPFEDELYSQHCYELFAEDEAWQEYEYSADDPRQWLWRSYECIDYPNRYTVAQFAVDMGYKDNPQLHHSMYAVTSMSMEDDESSLRKANLWYISFNEFGDREVIHHLTMFLDSNQTNEERRQNETDEINFAINSGLAEPNQDDLLNLGWTLEILKHGKQNPTED